MNIFAILNFLVLISALILFAVFYSLSLIPVKLSKKYGDESWDKCGRYRLVASIIESITVFNIIIWVFFPIPGLYFPIFSEIWISIIVGGLIIVPFGVIMYKGMKDAGTETIRPSKETGLYGGIYNYIRHPQTLGEFPMFPIFGLMANSWTIFFIGLIFIIIYTPIMIKIEEDDLVRRFGDEYIEYKRNTGCLFPRLKSSKNRYKSDDKSINSSNEE
ncbi:MAG: methyltransferase family protein [Promethearchaeota archaeon]